MRKLALGDYAALLRVLKKLPAEVGKFMAENSDENLQDQGVLFANLPAIVADSIPEFAEVLAVASDKDADFFLKGDLADAIEVFAAVLQLNDYTRIATTIKKLTAQRSELTGEARKAKAKAKQAN